MSTATTPTETAGHTVEIRHVDDIDVALKTRLTRQEANDYAEQFNAANGESGYHARVLEPVTFVKPLPGRVTVDVPGYDPVSAEVVGQWGQPMYSVDIVDALGEVLETPVAGVSRDVAEQFVFGYNADSDGTTRAQRMPDGRVVVDAMLRLTLPAQQVEADGGREVGL